MRTGLPPVVWWAEVIAPPFYLHQGISWLRQRNTPRCEKTNVRYSKNDDVSSVLHMVSHICEDCRGCNDEYVPAVFAKISGVTEANADLSHLTKEHGPSRIGNLGHGNWGGGCMVLDLPGHSICAQRRELRPVGYSCEEQSSILNFWQCIQFHHVRV